MEIRLEWTRSLKGSTAVFPGDGLRYEHLHFSTPRGNDCDEFVIPVARLTLSLEMVFDIRIQL